MPFKVGNSTFIVTSLVFLLAVPGGKSEAQHAIRSWEVAGPYPADQVGLVDYPESHISQATWLTVETDTSGLVNLGALIHREQPGTNLVIARHVFSSSRDQLIDFNFGFADTITVFFNGEGWFLGRNLGNPFDPSFSGDHRGSLQAKEGLNEILLVVRSASDTWGFSAGTDVPLEPPTNGLPLPPGLRDSLKAAAMNSSAPR